MNATQRLSRNPVTGVAMNAPRNGRVVVVGLLAATLFALVLPAQQPAVTLPEGSRLQVRAWDATSGLPQNTVTALHFDRQGMLWCGTFGGLCRFDGYEWQVEIARDNGLVDQRITALGEDAAGNLVVGTELSTVYRRQGQRFEVLAKLAEGHLRALAALPDGRLLCGSGSGWFEIGDAGAVRSVASHGCGAGRVALHAADGTVLLVGRSGVALLEGGMVRLLESPACSSAARIPNDPDGAFVFGTDHGVFELRGSKVAPLLGPQYEPLRDAAVTAVVPGKDGRLWFGTNNSVCCVHPTGEVPTLVASTAHRVRSLAIDASGAVWIGFEGGGLARLSEGEVALHRLVVAAGAPPEPHSLASDGRGGWHLGTVGGLYRFVDGHFVVDPRLAVEPVGGLLRTADGTLWVGLGNGVAAVRGEQVQTFVQPQGSLIRALHQDAGGRLWCGTSDGLMWLERGAFVVPPEPLRLRGEVVKLLAPGHGGELWIGTDRSLLCVAADHGVVRHLRHDVELPRGEVRAVLPGAAGRVWLGCYGGGFVAVDGAAVRVVSAQQGLFDCFVCSVVPMGEHWVVGSNRGTFLVDPRELDDVVDGRRTQIFCRPLFGPRGAAAEANGGVQPSAVCAGSTVMLCGVRGVLEVDGDAMHSWPAPADAVVNSVFAGGRTLLSVQADRVQLDASFERVLTVEVTSPQFDAPELQRYRWRLLPQQERWTEPSRNRQISFGIDAPGDHVLQVQACSVDGQFSRGVTTLSIQVAPRLLERTSFQVSAVLAALLLGVLAIRFGGRRQVRRARLLRRLVDERTVELRGLHAGLEQRVAERTAELSSALEQLSIDHEERMRLERELQQFQRMESLGALAGGVAHDFNNLLTVVLGNAGLLEGGLVQDPDLLELAQRIRQAAEQGRRMTRHLLTVASREVVAPATLDLNAHLREQRTILAELVGANVRLQLHVAPGTLPVRAAKGQIEQVLTNLCVNARDAMPEGGTVQITCEAAAGGVELRVADDGVGMDSELQRRIFDPFFTTKRVGRGTGLGLATVYGIVKQLGGKIAVDSEPGRGATFVIWLPNVEEAACPIPRPPNEASRSLRT